MVFTRRRFLQQAGACSALSLAGSLDLLGLSSAAAQSGDYKALVCLFLFGGNDANSMVIPYSDYASYNLVRPLATGVNVAQSLMTPIAPANLPGQTFGLHPAFTATNGNPTLTSLFQSGKLAVVCNTGTLVEPLTRAEYRARSKQTPAAAVLAQRPAAAVPDVHFPGLGALGADRLGRAHRRQARGDMNGPGATPIGMSFSGSQTFLNGKSVRGLSLPTAGNFGYTGDSPTPNAVQMARAAARGEMIASIDSNAMVSAAQANMGAALSASQRINPILNGTLPTSISGPFNGLTSGLANQLRAVARLINNRASLGQRRQIFFVSIGGFDTHTAQGQFQGPTPSFNGLAGLYQQIGQAMSAFYQSTVNMNVASDVTTFMLSDFGRTFKPNGVGTDHAWGGHYFVMGGSVAGNNFYGQFPTLALGGPSDADSLGRWIPTVSVEQYGGTLARWFGVPDTDLAQVFPGLDRFPTSNLGFLV